MGAVGWIAKEVKNGSLGDAEEWMLGEAKEWVLVVAEECMRTHEWTSCI